jgi:hypothetical protein
MLAGMLVWVPAHVDHSLVQLPGLRQVDQAAAAAGLLWMMSQSFSGVSFFRALRRGPVRRLMADQSRSRADEVAWADSNRQAAAATRGEYLGLPILSHQPQTSSARALWSALPAQPAVPLGPTERHCTSAAALERQGAARDLPEAAQLLLRGPELLLAPQPWQLLLALIGNHVA